MPARGFRISFTALRSNARRAPSNAVRRRLDKYNFGFVKEVVEYTSEYPAETESSYVRTHTLLRSWQIKNTSSGSRISYSFSNYARDPKGRYYARLVHGPSPQNQWPPHADTGWRTVEEGIDVIGGRDLFRQGAQHIIDSELSVKSNGFG